MGKVCISNKYLIRIPSKPVEEVFNFIKLYNKYRNDDLIDGLFEIIDHNYEAFFLASPDFVKYLDNLKGKTISSEEMRRVISSLYKYLSRMSTRCTPFGLFAGSALGTLGDSAAITFSLDRKQQFSRLDMHFAAALCDYLNKLPEIRNNVLFSFNDTLYQVGDSFRYIEFNYREKKREYIVSSIHGNELLESIYVAFQGRFYLSELYSYFKGQGLTERESESFVEKLIDSQIILSELQPNVTGEECFKNLISAIEKLNGTESITADLKKAARLIDSEDWSPRISEQLKSILSRYVATDVRDLIQTDLFIAFKENRLPKLVFEEVKDSIVKLAKIREAYVSRAMERFIKAFRTKYDGQEIPLLIALDPEVGIGYGSNVPGEAEYLPLVEGISVPLIVLEKTYLLSEHEKQYFEAISTAIHNKTRVLNIDVPDTKSEEKFEKISLPRSMYLFGSILASSQEDLNEGAYQFLVKTIHGPSAGNIIGRFCYSSPEMTAMVKDLLEEEESSDPGAIYAEIVHLPEARVGNVIMRPVFRKYEIPILTKSSVKEDNQIPLKDLMVSVHNGRVVLRSKRLNRIVKPRLTNAHNFSKGLPYYRFLADLQADGFNYLDLWRWSYFEDSTFLPRIQYKKVIIQRARWVLKKEAFLKYCKETPGVCERDYLVQLIHNEQIPRQVVIVEGDNELMVDLGSEIGLEILAATLKKKNVVLKEFLYQPENCFIKDEKGSYANELVIPLAVKTPVATDPTRDGTLESNYLEVNPGLKRMFSTGDKWLYFKIYTGNKTADKILTAVIKPLAAALSEDGTIEKWFFIRYNEHGEHLRVRFYHSQNPEFWQKVVVQMHKYLSPYEEQGLVHKIQLDTYHREVERYGLMTMELSETLFYNDSLAVSEFLDLITGDKGEVYRWLFALLNVDMLLDDYGLTLHEKFQLMTQLREYFYEETNKGRSFKKLWVSLNNKYRAYARDIYNLLENRECNGEDVEDAIECFRRRSARNREPIALVKERLVSGENGGVSLFGFLSSHIHMTMNRTFLAKQRLHETVIYHLLVKFYDSKISRQNNYKKEKTEKNLLAKQL